MAKDKRAKSVDIDALRHKDRRANIPTEELRDFVAEDEVKPKTILYPRDPSLDPQLVWKGKDEQDSKPLEVPAVPVYIQDPPPGLPFQPPGVRAHAIQHAPRAGTQVLVRCLGKPGILGL